MNLIVIQLLSLIVDANAEKGKYAINNVYFKQYQGDSRYFQPVEQKVRCATLYNNCEDDNQRGGCQHCLTRVRHRISYGQSK